MTNKSSYGLMLLIFTIGIISSDLFGYSNPTISSIVPYNPRVGDTVLITGTGFDPSNFLVNKVYFNSSVYVFPSTEYDSIQAEILTVTTNTITAIAPLGAYYGNLSVSVNGLNSSSEIYFSMTPTIESFTPSLGYVGDTITIAGTGFNWVQPVFVRIGFTNGWDTGPISATQTSLRVVVPIGSTTGPIKLSTTTSPFDFAVIPIVNNLSPSSGLVGSEVSIYGLGFDPNETDYQVYFNGVKGEINLINSTFIRAIVPHRASSGNVVVLVEGDTIKGPTLQFEVTPSNVRIYSYSSYSGFIGDSIIINGTGFDQAGPPLTVKFGGIPTVIQSYDDKSIQTTIPQAALSGSIEVTSGGIAENGPGFKIIEKIDFASHKHIQVGDTMSLVGSGFYYLNTDYYLLSFGNGLSVVSQKVSDTTISFVIPYFATSGNPVLYSDQNSSVFFELPYLGIRPKINRVSPDTVIAGRNHQITIDGTGFGRTAVTKDYKILFAGNTEQKNISNNNYTEETDNGYIQIKTTVPLTAESGYVTLIIDSLQAISPKQLIVLPDTFPYKPEAPAFIAFSSVTTNSFKINWNRPYRALGFLIDISEDNFSTFLSGFNSANTNDTLMSILGLQSGSEYQVRIRSYSETDTSDYRILQIITIPSAPVALAPTRLSPNTSLLQWTKSKGAERYSVELSVDDFETVETIDWGDNEIVIEVTDEEIAFFGFRVRAYNVSGTSEYSNSVLVIVTDIEGMDSKILIYPNPVYNLLSVRNLSEESVEFVMLDDLGKSHKLTAQLSDEGYSIDVSHLKSGYYILKISSTRKSVYFKILKL